MTDDKKQNSPAENASSSSADPASASPGPASAARSKSRLARSENLTRCLRNPIEPSQRRRPRRLPTAMRRRVPRPNGPRKWSVRRRRSTWKSRHPRNHRRRCRRPQAGRGPPKNCFPLRPPSAFLQTCRPRSMKPWETSRSTPCWRRKRARRRKPDRPSIWTSPVWRASLNVIGNSYSSA